MIQYSLSAWDGVDDQAISGLTPLDLWRASDIPVAEAHLSVLLEGVGDNGLVYGTREMMSLGALAAMSKVAVFTENEVLECLMKIHAEGSRDMERFRRLAHALVKTKQRRAEVARRTWLFALPLEAKWQSGRALPVHVDVLGQRFVLSDSQNATNEKVRDLLGVEAVPSLPEGSLYCLCAGNAVSWYEAWGPFYLPGEVARGLVDMHENGSRHRFSIGQEFATSALPPVKRFYHTSDMRRWQEVDLSGMSRSRHPEDHCLSIKDDLVAWFTKMVADVGVPASPGSVLELIQAACRLYTTAHDRASFIDRLLPLWQMAETLTVSGDTKGATDLIAKRMGAALKRSLPNSPTLLPLVQRLGAARNRLVHSGQVDFGPKDVERLMFLCELLFWWVMETEPSIHTANGLQQLFIVMTSEDEKVGHLREAIRHLDAEAQKPAVDGNGAP